MFITKFNLLPLRTLLLLWLSCANHANGDECVDNEVRMIESPESKLAVIGIDEIVEFDCVGCAPTLTFKITANNQTQYVVCGVKKDYAGVGNVYFVVEQNENQPLNCTLYINITLLDVNEVLIVCELEKVCYANATLTLQKTGNTTLFSDPPVSPTVTIDQTTTDTLNDSITSPNITGTTPSSKTGTLGSGAIAGIVIALVLAVSIAIAVFAVVLVYCSCKERPTGRSFFRMRSKGGEGEIKNGEAETQAQDSKQSKRILGRDVRPDGGVRRRK